VALHPSPPTPPFSLPTLCRVFSRRYITELEQALHLTSSSAEGATPTVGGADHAGSRGAATAGAASSPGTPASSPSVGSPAPSDIGSSADGSAGGSAAARALRAPSTAAASSAGAGSPAPVMSPVLDFGALADGIAMSRPVPVRGGDGGETS
jgi:hypothetical protein